MHTQAHQPLATLRQSGVSGLAFFATNPFSICLLIVLLYMVLEMWLGNFAVAPTQFLTEVPILLLLFFLFTGVQRRPILSLILFVILILTLYFIHDFYFYVLGQILRISDLVTLPILLNIIPFWQLFTLVGALAIYLIFFVYNLKIPSTAVILTLIATLLIGQQTVLKNNKKVYMWLIEFTGYSVFNPHKFINNHGRLYSFLTENIVRNHHIGLFHEAIGDELDANDLGSLTNLSHKKANIHLLISESYIDVRSFQALDLPNHLASAAYQARFDDLVNYSISPVFGRGTPNAELEVLCGVPSLRVVHTIEFEMFTGNPTPCLPRLLKDVGYHVLASHPYKPTTFNRNNAYPALGFDDIWFAQNKAALDNIGFKLNDMDDEWLFDGAFYEQNLARIKPLLKNDKPIFNYLLNVGGHYPFTLGQQRPRIADFNDNALLKDLEFGGIFDREDNEQWILDVVSHFKYRSEALVNYIDELITIDPTAIILVVGDHLPPGLDYDALNFVQDPRLPQHMQLRKNFLFAYADGKRIDLGVTRHQDLFYFVLQQLSNGQFCEQFECVRGTLEIETDKAPFLPRYQQIISKAIKPFTQSNDQLSASVKTNPS